MDGLFRTSAEFGTVLKQFIEQVGQHVVDIFAAQPTRWHDFRDLQGGVGSPVIGAEAVAPPMAGQVSGIEGHGGIVGGNGR